MSGVFVIFEGDSTAPTGRPDIIGVALTREDAERAVVMPPGSWRYRGFKEVEVLP